MKKTFLLYIRKIDAKIIITIVGAKIAVACIMLLAFSLLPFGYGYFLENFQYPTSQHVTLQTAFKTWDAQHYLYLSEKGYSANIISNGFSPLLPILMHTLSYITKNGLASGLIIANVSSLIAFYTFYLLVKRMYTEQIAFKSLLFLLIFPTSFYFSLIYSESIFFLLVMLFFFFLQKKNLFLTSLSACLMPLARIIGIAIIIPFFFSYILEYLNHSLDDQISIIGRSLLTKKTFFLLSPIIGFCVLLLFMYVTTGNPFAQFIAQKAYVAQHSFFSLFNPLVLIKQFFIFPLAVHGYTNSILDRSFFLGFLIFLPFLYKRVSLVFFIYACLFGILPVMSGSFMSYTRYIVVVFPLYIAFAKLSLEKKYKNFAFTFAYFLLLLQSLFLIMHSLNYWVS